MGLAQRYLIALGSNVRHARFGPPSRVLAAALRSLAGAGVVVEASSGVIMTPPLGPSRRRFANGAAIVAAELPPERLLDLLQEIERDFGRKRRGQRWSARVLDLDIILWSGGPWSDSRLTLPHPQFRRRGFVLAPAVAIAPGWRDPVTRLTLRQLDRRRRRPRRLTHPDRLP